METNYQVHCCVRNFVPQTKIYLSQVTVWIVVSGEGGEAFNQMNNELQTHTICCDTDQQKKTFSSMSKSKYGCQPLFSDFSLLSQGKAKKSAHIMKRQPTPLLAMRDVESRRLIVTTTKIKLFEYERPPIMSVSLLFLCLFAALANKINKMLGWKTGCDNEIAPDATACALQEDWSR